MNYSVVAHRFWGDPGGGQLVCAAVAYSLERLGLTPVLSGVFKFDPAKYKEWFGIDLSRYPVVTLPFELNAFGLYSRLASWWPAKKAIDKYKPSLVFIDEPTYKPLARGRMYRLIEYIHFPLEVVLSPEIKKRAYAEGRDPYFEERYSKFPLNVYWWLFSKLLPMVKRENPFLSADLVLVNSRWIADLVQLAFGERPEVLNPPIAPNVDVVERPRPFEERKPIVVMLGRFSQEKRYHWVVREVAPRLVKEVPGARFVIFGGAATPTLRAYYERVKSLASEAGLRVSDDLSKEADVYLVANASRRLINEVMDGARAFLHATINEHWGIAVAEAMARGLPVVVHKSGGAWTDLAEEGRVGLGYEDAGGAVDVVARLLTDGKQWAALSAKSVEKARGLRLEIFAQKFGEFVRRLS
ncbi:Glycosyltransferase [Pyrobaculum oguniense TE7]|uniref:Glycosyltransferase n=1 Tax=Pyrobaculum oguniense (strain DSM 13380 / JCM 10595 / TE7) TaxID=698757 RepID=H6QB55_PYROT|nr:Glycosyltransferase [Pyrobaculum oguniense TE7]